MLDTKAQIDTEMVEPIPALSPDDEARIGRFIAVNTPRPPSLRALYNPIQGYWYVADRSTGKVIAAGYRNQYEAKQAHGIEPECNFFGFPTAREQEQEP